MKKLGPWLVLLAILSMSFTGVSYAAPGMRGGGWGMNSQYGRMFNPKTVETVSGEVMKVDKIMPMRGMSYGIHLTLKTDKGDISVHLGPAWYIDKQEPAIKVGDKIDVEGLQGHLQGKPRYNRPGTPEGRLSADAAGRKRHANVGRTEDGPINKIL